VQHLLHQLLQALMADGDWAIEVVVTAALLE
jgi:hypothetical protein